MGKILSSAKSKNDSKLTVATDTKIDSEKNNSAPRAGFSGVWIPAHIILDKNLTPAEKFVYGNIQGFEKACFESNAVIGAKLGIDEVTVSRAISKLRSKKYVYVYFQGGHTSRRQIIAINDDPKKIEYLCKVGHFSTDYTKQSSHQSGTIPNGQVDYTKQSSHLQMETIPNGQPNNKRIIKQEKGDSSKLDPAFGLEGQADSIGSRRPRRSDFATREEFVSAYENFRVQI